MGVLDEFLAGLEGFEWHSSNSDKNWHNHQVRQSEAEQILLNRPLVFASDVKHSQAEARYFSLGRTDGGRHFAIVFTTRRHRVRVISVRTMSRAERRVYGKVIVPAQGNS